MTCSDACCINHAESKEARTNLDDGHHGSLGEQMSRSGVTCWDEKDVMLLFCVPVCRGYITPEVVGKLQGPQTQDVAAFF